MMMMMIMIKIMMMMMMTRAGLILQCEKGRTGEVAGLLDIAEKLKNEGQILLVVHEFIR